MKGKVKFFNTNKGFGFIAGEDNHDYFVHHSQIQGLVYKDDQVEFETKETDKGLQALNVKKLVGAT